MCLVFEEWKLQHLSLHVVLILSVSEVTWGGRFCICFATFSTTVRICAGVTSLCVCWAIFPIKWGFNTQTLKTDAHLFWEGVLRFVSPSPPTAGSTYFWVVCTCERLNSKLQCQSPSGWIFLFFHSDCAHCWVKKIKGGQRGIQLVSLFQVINKFTVDVSSVLTGCCQCNCCIQPPDAMRLLSVCSSTCCGSYIKASMSNCTDMKNLWLLLTFWMGSKGWDTRLTSVQWGQHFKN